MVLPDWFIATVALLGLGTMAAMPAAVAIIIRGHLSRRKPPPEFDDFHRVEAEAWRDPSTVQGKIYLYIKDNGKVTNDAIADELEMTVREVGKRTYDLHTTGRIKWTGERVGNMKVWEAIL